jgi:hypothetical protein
VLVGIIQLDESTDRLGAGVTCPDAIVAVVRLRIAENPRDSVTLVVAKITVVRILGGIPV